jgi:hypothetical protein
MVISHAESTRKRLPQRRASETFNIECAGLAFTVTVGRFEDGGVAEVFVTNHKAGSTAGIMASDAAVLASIALQYGAPLETLRAALMRDGGGRAMGPVGVVLDRIAAESEVTL